MAFNPASQSPRSPIEDNDPTVVITDRDIVFDCPKCGGELVVDRDGEGMQLNCVHCGAPVLVPMFAESKAKERKGEVVVGRSATGEKAPAAKAPAKKLSFDFSNLSPDDAQKKLTDLKLQIKENESQRVETRGHLNRTMLQVHRYQMGLERLNSRREELDQELEAIQMHLGVEG